MKTGCVFLININDNGFGTGFFCYIPFPNNMKLLPVLITNNHVLNKNNIEIGKILQITVNNHNYKLIIDENRRTYTNEEYDITIIEITENDVFYNNYKFFLQIDDLKDGEYKDQPIYLIHFPLFEQISHSTGVIALRDDFLFMHFCPTKSGSSGGPILNLNNFKVLGLHKGYDSSHNYNYGIFLKKPIEEFNNTFKDMNCFSEKNTINSQMLHKKFLNNNNNINTKGITIIYINRKESEFKGEGRKNVENSTNEKVSKNKIFGETFVKNNKNKCSIIINGKEQELVSFYNISSLKEDSEILTINLIGFQNIKDLSYMFCGCLSLYSLLDSSEFYMENITNISKPYVYML